MKTTRTIAMFAASALMTLIAGCMTTDSYVVTVTERATTRPVDGATIEVTSEGSKDVAARATTNDHGEGVIVLRSDERGAMIITFDGMTDRYFLRPELAPNWQEAPTTSDQPTAALHFMPGAPSSRSSPLWSVRVFRLK